jgi:hypothetical protein
MGQRANRRLALDQTRQNPFRLPLDIAVFSGAEYEGISDPIIWNVVNDELPRLKAAVEALTRNLRE